MHWRGKSGPCWWSYFTGTISKDDWDQYLQMCRELVAGVMNERSVVLAMAYRSTSPTAPQRGALADLLKQYEAQFQRLEAFALVSDSAIVRGTVTAINWLTHKPFPEKVFGDPREALDWLHGVEPGVRPQKVIADMAHVISPDLLWVRPEETVAAP